MEHPGNSKHFSIHVHVELLHSDGEYKWKSQSVQCEAVAGAGADVMFNEQLEWEYKSDGLTFLRCVIVLFALLYLTKL